MNSLDDLVLAYRQGNKEAPGDLLTRFSGLSGKYKALLAYGKYSGDLDGRAFLFMLGKGLPESTAQIISSRVRRAMEPEDISQECDLCILETARRFLNVAGNYRFVLKERLIDILDQELLINTLPEEYTLEDAFGDHYRPEVIIDEKWITGETADLFAELSPVQRRIVQMVWLEKHNEGVVCNALGLTKDKLQKIKREIKALLRP